MADLFDFAETEDTPVVHEQRPEGRHEEVQFRTVPEGSIPSPAPDSDWQEVPQARFLSWSDAMQLAYCAARDMASAEQEDNAYWLSFYLRRAETYR